MMSYCSKESRRRAEEEIWRQGNDDDLPDYDLTEQVLRLQQQAQNICPTDYTPFASLPQDQNFCPLLYQPDLLEPGLYQNGYESSSPDFSPRSQAQHSRFFPTENLHCHQEFNPGLVDFFGEQFTGMEDTFRSALMQYFSQVDHEKQGLTADLQKIKEDFRKYEEEGKRFKVDSIQKGKIIRKLTENGKLFVKEIERLKDELRETELQRRQLVAENNDLEKRVQYEGNAIPQLEKQLKCLSEENQYLKLLADDTKKLSQQEKEIESYAEKLEQQRQINQQQRHNLQKHEYAIKKLSKINGELCLKINQLSQYKDVNETLHEAQEMLAETRQKHESLQFEYKKLQFECQQREAKEDQLRKSLESFEQEMKMCREDNQKLTIRCEHLNRDCEGKDNFIQTMERRLKESHLHHDEDRKELDEKEITCRNLEEEIANLQQEVSSLRNEIKMANMKSDALVYEDELRNRDFEKLNKELIESEKMCREYVEKEKRYKDDISESKAMIDLLTQTEERYKRQLKELQKELQDSLDYSKKLELRHEEQVTREKKLENEILTHVKTQSEMEQEIAITYNTIETLRKSNESCNDQRVKVQQELVLVEDRLSTLEHKPTANEIAFEKELKELKKKYENCENQRNRLQKEILIVQEKLSVTENTKPLIHDVERELKKYKTECDRLKEELIESKNKLESYKNKLKSFEENSFVCCSSVDEWKVDLEFSLPDGPRQHSELNKNHAKPLNSDIKKNICANCKNELKNSDDTSGREIKEYQNMKIESTNKTILINKLQNDINNKEGTIQIMNRQINQLEKDLHDVVDELSQLRQSYETCQEDLQDKDFNISDLKHNLNQLELNLKDKDNLVGDLEELVDELQRELDKLSNNHEEELNGVQKDLSDKNKLIENLEKVIEELHINFDETARAKEDQKVLQIREIEEYSLTLNQELQNKNIVINELEARCQKLQSEKAAKENEVENLCRGIEKLKETTELSKTSTDESEYKQFQKERIEALEEALLEKDKRLGSLQSIETLGHEKLTNKSHSVELYEEKIKNKDLKIQQLELENQTISDRLRQLKSPSNVLSPSKVIDYSFEDENVVSKEKYLDIVDRLEEKKNIIIELQDLLQLFQQEVDEASSLQLELQVDVIKKPECRQQLQLPKPLPSNQTKTNNQRRSSLPPIPGSHSPQLFSSRPLSSNSDRVITRPPSHNSSRNQQGQETLDKMPKELNNLSSDNLRKKLVKLNTELLQKKLDISALEEELKVSKRKQVRTDELYRNVVAKNESLEHEILENRRKIRDVQNKQNVTEVYETQVYGMKKDMKEIERSFDTVLRENHLISNEIKDKDEEVSSLERRLGEADQEINHWKHHVGVLEKECQTLTSNIEEMRNEIGMQQNTIQDLKVDFNIVEKERESWKENAQKHEYIHEDTRRQNKTLQDEILQKMKIIDKQREQLNATEQEREIFEYKVKENEAEMDEMLQKITHAEAENIELLKVNENLRKELHSNHQKQEEVKSEKDIALHNTKYLESKIGDLKQKLKAKDEKINKYRENIDGNDEQISNIMKEISASNFEVQQLTKELEKEKENILRLERLNDDMNKENKRLMHELISLQDRLKTANEENTIRREKVTKLEHEQSDLDNLLLKTQKSNSELLHANKQINDEMRTIKENVAKLENELENKDIVKNELERQLQTSQRELDMATEKLGCDNQSLLQELHEARRVITEMEAILDQGQLDFDEMDVELDRYRRENIELDRKLHEVLKQQIALQSEQEESQRRITSLTDQIHILQDEIENKKKEQEMCSKDKEDVEELLHECKTREDYFEERLRGLEKTLNSKEETLVTERKEKGKLQDDVVKLQAELIETKTRVDKLRNEKDIIQKNLSDKKKELEVFEKSEKCLLLEREDVREKLDEQSRMLSEYVKQISWLKKEKDDTEGQYHEVNLQLQVVEQELEEEKMKRHNDHEELLTQISNLKRDLNEKEIVNEKNSYQQITSDSDLKTAVENNIKLQQEIEQLEYDKSAEREKLLETISDFKEQIKLIEHDKSQEFLQIKATMEALEDSRGKDITLLKSKLQEVNELKHQLDLEQSSKNEKDTEIEALKEDIIQLQTTLNLAEARNKEIMDEIDESKAHINYLEKNKHEIEGTKKNLLENIKSTEDSLKILKQQNDLHQAEKQRLLTEKEGLQTSFDQMLQAKRTEYQRHEEVISALRKELVTFKGIKEENENLKSDLEALLSERQELQSHRGENSQLRSENFNLRTQADRVRNLLDENRNLSQSLVEIKRKHAEEVERSSRENMTLRRNVDDLFKRNQDLELRNAIAVQTKPINVSFETSQQRDTFGRTKLNNVPFETSQQKDNFGWTKPKSASINNIHDAGFGMEAFSPIENGVATSTPTQESHRITQSILTSKASSMERINTNQQSKAMSMEHLPQKDQSFDGSLSSRRENQLATGPLVKSKTVHGSLIEIHGRKPDASWNQPQPENQSSSIKSNIFFELDRTVAAKSKWKSAVTSNKTTLSNVSSPTKTPQQQRTGGIFKFDMRPRSTDIPDVDRGTSHVAAASPSGQVGIGNEYVNRIKANFEKSL
ncbi:centromere-associated protein E-like [Hydractinia symbiolongicarpus]|uniref:centromere-associated protein E-like n=1 Tax=Hydractinia symbiolongicarpus TaxID=13093 RepID=UPI00254BB671|nr:centromere-associated protein E-like [Hydractinia symbiolongicarpus]